MISTEYLDIALYLLMLGAICFLIAAMLFREAARDLDNTCFFVSCAGDKCVRENGRGPDKLYCLQHGIVMGCDETERRYYDEH